MLKVLEYSITHFFEHILRLHIEKAEDIVGELYGASIPVMEKVVENIIFIYFFQKNFYKQLLMF